MLSENNNKIIERVSGRIKSLLELFNKEEGASVTISIDKESEVIRICIQPLLKKHPLRHQKCLNYLMPHQNIILIGVFFIMPLKYQKQFLMNGIRILVKIQSVKCYGEQIKSRWLEKIYE